MIKYLLLCIVSVLTGTGILKISRVHLSFSHAFFLAPIITLSFWTLYLAWGILLGFPVKNLWLLGWFLTGIFSFLGISSLFFSRQNKSIYLKTFVIFLFVILIPVGVMSDYFSYGLFKYGGSDQFDGWPYIAYGQYLWENVRGAEGQLIPLHQYASHLATTRFISSALLAFFSPFIGYLGDTQATANLFLAWCIFNFASACAFFGMAQKFDKYIPFYLIIVIFSGWTIRVLAFNNFDNALILALLPTFAGISVLFNEDKFKWSIILACLAATTFYCYTELSPIILFCAAILFFYILSNIKSNKITLFILIALSIMLVSPYLREATQFILVQFNGSKMPGGRPGETLLSSLLEYNQQFFSFWGFSNSGEIATAVGITFFCLTLLGLFLLWFEKKQAFVFVCVLLLLGTCEMVYHQRYGYGAYKLIVLNWWLLMFCFIKSIQKILNSLSTYIKALAISLCFVFIASYINITYATLLTYSNYASIKNIKVLRKLYDIKSLIGNKAILIFVNHPIYNPWAIYFLRETPIKLINYQGHMSLTHVIPTMERAKKVKLNDIGFALTNDNTIFPTNYLVWAHGPYYLWKLPKNWIFITSIENQNGVENWGFWVGKGETKIKFLSSKQGLANFTGLISPGACLTKKSEYRIAVKTGGHYQKVVKIKPNKKFSITFPVNKNINEITLRPLDKPDRFFKHDKRPMLFGLSHFHVNLLTNMDNI